jgi:hypothetical protein
VPDNTAKGYFIELMLLRSADKLPEGAIWLYELGSTLVSIPARSTENNDHKPPRIAERNPFDLGIGQDNLSRGDKYKVSPRVSASLRARVDERVHAQA